MTLSQESHDGSRRADAKNVGGFTLAVASAGLAESGPDSLFLKVVASAGIIGGLVAMGVHKPLVEVGRQLWAARSPEQSQ